MSIEGGGPSGIGGGVGGSAMPGGIEAGGFVAGPIIKEGPVGLADLKATVPWQAELPKPLGEIRFEQSVQVDTGLLSEDAVVAEAEAIISQAQKPQLMQVTEVATPFSAIPRVANEPGPILQVEPSIFPGAWPRIEPVVVPNDLEYPQPQVVASPSVEPFVQPGLQLKDQVFNEARPIILTQPALEEQEIQEEVISERIAEKQIDIVNEKVEDQMKKFVVDKPTLAQRLQEVRQAIQKAKPEAERLGYGRKIIGWIIEQFLPPAHPGNMSRVVRPEGPDGTIPIIKEAIKAKAEFDSEEDVQSEVLNNRPVSTEEDGEPVSDEEVRKVFQDRIVKPDQPPKQLDPE